MVEVVVGGGEGAKEGGEKLGFVDLAEERHG